jgi:F-type H+-transporting ATPase subunit delta
MFGASRDSVARASGVLETYREQPDFALVANDLFAVAALLTDETQLRSTLADAGQAGQIRSGLLRDVLANQVSPSTMAILEGLATSRWSDDMDLVLAIERLAAQAAFTNAEQRGELDQTEEELFRFGRAVDASPQLQMALTDPAQSAATKAAIVSDLLSGRATNTTLEVLTYVVGHLHGQRLDTVIDQLVDLAAEQRQRVVAEIRVAAPLTPEQMNRLQAALTTMKGRTVRLNVAVDPAVLGGVHVSIDDEVIDGTVAAKLEQARRAVLG